MHQTQHRRQASISSLRQANRYRFALGRLRLAPRVSHSHLSLGTNIAVRSFVRLAQGVQVARVFSPIFYDSLLVGKEVWRENKDNARRFGGKICNSVQRTHLHRAAGA
jgi:hypothetical protein